MLNRYDTNSLTEAQFEPGSRGRVLKNLLGIRSKRQMDALEAVKLSQATAWSFGQYSSDHRFTAKDICLLHQQWLGGIYAWAGQYRQVNIGKGGFAFAMAAQIPRLMEKFEGSELQRYTPCVFHDRESIVEALAIVHCELVLIHPFREGNGRLSRLVATLMALQSGLPLLDFSGIRGAAKEGYFLAVQAGIQRDYRPMKAVFGAVLARSGA